MARRKIKRIRNRATTRRNARISWPPFTGAILLVVILALVYMSFADKNKALLNEICGQQRELDRLYKEYTREEARWNAMKSAEMLEASMRAHGIDMNLPLPRQIVKMGADGKPVKGQHSLVWFRKHFIAGDVAKSGSTR